MIGVLASGSDGRIVSEFFELFKTPWEYLRPDHTYEVILCVGNAKFDRNATKLVLHYANCRLPIDAEEGIDTTVHNSSELTSQNRHSLVIYEDHLSFCDTGAASPGEDKVVEHFSYRCIRDGVRIERIGYDLFAEITHLLTVGQPEEFARFPTLDLHISLLRELIVASGNELLEIPPVPEGYGCIACLTHDIDHPAIRFHKWDSTAFGFLYRATAGSLVNFVRGRMSFRDLIKNWIAAAKLPFVYMGLAKDIWSGFDDRYLEIENEIRSTYFVIPFGNHPGTDVNGPAPRRRAAGYGAQDIKDALLKIKANGCEVALHGIDAWHNSESGRREFEEVRKLTGETEVGVRMHWLFFNEESPKVLEDAGAAYDSTIGYRATVGFRSGTAQVYKPQQTSHLLELPLHVMDTALFYPAYSNLSSRDASSVLSNLVDQLESFGGCLTINWHDRSLAPERLWHAAYKELVADLKRREAWFATASQAVAWFRKRRSTVFGSDGLVRMDAECATNADGDKLPSVVLRTHIPRTNGPKATTLRFVDVPLQVKSGQMTNIISDSSKI